MVMDVKARFSNGALKPLEPLELEEGAEVTLRIIEVVSAEMASPTSLKTEKAPTSNSGTHPVIAMIDRLRAEFPNLADDDCLPPDGAKNYKHYLYGHPKEND
ncbi:MAG: DUF104 domain-containing protein [Dehalococcoidia bacterium]|nr:DUF104 domain-containing protein [Dehalococcoidia bacterium]